MKIKQSIHFGWFAWLIYGVLTTYSLAAHSFCLDGRHPKVEQEYAASHSVILGKVMGVKNVSSPDDPEGIAATIYLIRVERRFKGPHMGKLAITSENTSSRFEMNVSKEYLLFVNNMDDNFYIDSCGNSGVSNDRKHEISMVKSIARHEK
jgi:hypothetical protein